MSTLERVAITGADDSVEPSELIELSKAYPFVEWGILVSKSNDGGPRYPSYAWREQLYREAKIPYAPFSLPEQLTKIAIHVQGAWLRGLLDGYDEEFIAGVGRLLRVADRIQLNFHGQKINYDRALCACALMRLPSQPKQFLVQQDGTDGFKFLLDMEETAPFLDLVPFHDTSHGAGILPEKWPTPAIKEYVQADDGKCEVQLTGYAGGLGPENLAEQIPLIAKAAGSGRFWIDMETKVRTRLFGPSLTADSICSVDLFDLHKVRKALEICAPFVDKEI